MQSYCLVTAALLGIVVCEDTVRSQGCIAVQKKKHNDSIAAGGVVCITGFNVRSQETNAFSARASWNLM